MAQKIGYIRVSTADQNTGRQLAEIKNTLDKVFEEKVSGKDMNRPKLQECINYIRPGAGDEVHVHSIDRLARDQKDLEAIIKKITKEGASIHFYKEKLTFTPEKDDPMQRLMLRMMGAFAQFEREIIRERQREGIAEAQAKGKPFGRPSALTDEQKAAVIADRANGMTPTELAKKYEVSRALIYRICPAN